MEQDQKGHSAKQRWYVLSANYKKEIAVRDELLAQGFQAYVPMKYVLLKVKGTRQRLLRPAIHELVFVRATKKELLDYKHSSRLNPYIFFRSIRYEQGWTPIVVPDADMANFMRLTAMAEVGLQYFKPEELRLAQGDKVRIMDGVFKGIVGTVQKLPHRRGDYLVVEIPGVSTVVARLKPEYVEPMSRRISPSTDVQGDVRRMDEIARQLLFELTDTLENEAARSVLLGEMTTIRRALAGSKTFMPQDKVAFSLAHVMAAKALGEDEGTVAEHVETLRRVTPTLRSVSMLRLRASLYLAVCHHDEASAAFVSTTVGQWKVGEMTESQKRFICEKRKVGKLSGSDGEVTAAGCHDDGADTVGK